MSATETKQQPEQICPIFTAALIMGNAQRAKAGVIQTPGIPQPITPPEQEAVPCARGMCQWWQPVMDQTGQTIGGNCTVPMLTKQVFEGVNVLGRVLQSLTPSIIPTKQH